MAFWLFKSEPEVFGWDHLVACGDKGHAWDGVRNYQARNHMRAMVLGDRGFFYHSRSGLAVIGIMEVCALSHPDGTTDDPRWDCVDVRVLQALPRPVTLAEIKATAALADMVLVRNPRLSVQPVTPGEWQTVCALGGLAA